MKNKMKEILEKCDEVEQQYKIKLRQSTNPTLNDFIAIIATLQWIKAMLNTMTEREGE